MYGLADPRRFCRQITLPVVIILRVRCSRCEIYTGHGRLCVCVCVCVCLSVCLSLCLSLVAFVAYYWTEPNVTWGNGWGVPSICALLGADLQSLHGFHCCDNITPSAKCQRVLVLATYLVSVVSAWCRKCLQRRARRCRTREPRMTRRRQPATRRSRPVAAACLPGLR